MLSTPRASSTREDEKTPIDKERVPKKPKVEPQVSSNPTILQTDESEAAPQLEPLVRPKGVLSSSFDGSNAAWRR